MDIHPKKPNKIRDIVRLQQILKKWRKLANSNSSSSSKPKSSINHFLKRTLSLNDRSNNNTTSTTDCTNDNSTSGSSSVPKGYLAVSVGEEQKRFVIPTEYLGRRAFHVLLREAEEEFGFEQTGVLRIPCQVSVFENVLKMVASSSHNNKRSSEDNYYAFFNDDVLGFGCCSSSGTHLDLGFSHDSPMCR